MARASRASSLLSDVSRASGPAKKTTAWIRGHLLSGRFFFRQVKSCPCVPPGPVSRPEAGLGLPGDQSRSKQSWL
ncbi:hypothetical protein MRX96_027082 [Rhipicephalus microplus]